MNRGSSDACNCENVCATAALV